MNTCFSLFVSRCLTIGNLCLEQHDCITDHLSILGLIAYVSARSGKYDIW